MCVYRYLCICVPRRTMGVIQSRAAPGKLVLQLQFKRPLQTIIRVTSSFCKNTIIEWSTTHYNIIAILFQSVAHGTLPVESYHSFVDSRSLQILSQKKSKFSEYLLVWLVKVVWLIARPSSNLCQAGASLVFRLHQSSPHVLPRKSVIKVTSTSTFKNIFQMQINSLL